MCVNCGVSSCSSCNKDSYIPSNTSALKYDGPKFVCPTDFTVLPGASLNDMMNTLMEQICTNASSVDSVTGLDTDNTDPENPIVQIAVDGVTITGEGTTASPLVSSGGGGGQVDSVVAGTNITVDNTDPINPIINASGGGGVTSIVAGTNVTISPVGGTGAVTVNSSGGGGFVHYLGEDFGGGIIYYLYKDNLGVERGLIVNKAEATTDWQTAASITNGDRTEDGVFNTALMINSGAATYVNGLTDGGFNDWYLPSIDELGLLYYNRYSAQKALRAGGFTLLSGLDFYWSSTEYLGIGAYYFDFLDGFADQAASKLTIQSTRAIRSF